MKLGLSLMLLLAFVVPGTLMARGFIELKTQNRLAKDEAAHFKAKLLDPAVKKIRLRYRCSEDEDFKWIDFQPQPDGERLAVIEKELINGPIIFYYIVWQKSDGSVEAVYGTPMDPLKIQVDRRSTSVVLRRYSPGKKAEKPILSVRGRFDDDDIEEQMAVFAASDWASRIDRPILFERGEKIGLGRIEQIGAIDLADLLMRFTKIDFEKKDGALRPIYQGLPANGRLGLRVDGIDQLDEFDGSLEWNVDSLSFAEVSLKDTAPFLMGNSGLFGKVLVESPRQRAYAAKFRGAWPEDFSMGVVAGQEIEAFENFWSLGLRRNEEALSASSLMRSEYWWSKEKEPFAVGQFQFFARAPRAQEMSRFVWNSALSFNLPISESLKSRLTINAGQTFQNSETMQNRSYRLLRAGLHLSNELQLSDRHLFQIESNASFVGIVHEPFHVESAFDLRRCNAFGIQSSFLNNCRLTASLSLTDKMRFSNWLAMSIGTQLVGVTEEVNNLASMLNPAAEIQISPDEAVDFSIGYASSLRWPTLFERYSHFLNDIDSPLTRRTKNLLPEKLRQVYLSAQLRYLFDYAHVTLDALARSGWLEDLIGVNSEVLGGPMWANRGQLQFSALNLWMSAKLAAANHIYFGSELHTQEAPYPRLKVVFGTRLNLGDFGSSHFEVQAHSLLSEGPAPLSRLNVFYQTRPLFEHMIFETLFSNLLSQPSIYGNVKVFL